MTSRHAWVCRLLAVMMAIGPSSFTRAERPGDGMVAPAAWESIPCQPNRDTGCMPTPEHCATGSYDGHWPGGVEGRFADCLAGRDALGNPNGRVAFYTASYMPAVCGISIVNDHAEEATIGWRDPNICGPASAPAGYGTAGRALPPTVASHGGVVATESALASDVGVRVLNAGGNAMDAGVATLFAIGVTRPEMCGIGAGGFLIYRTASGQTAALDFRETAPAALTPEAFAKDWTKGSAGHAVRFGHRMVGVPGVVDGMEKALARFGTISLAAAIAPAAALAENGFGMTVDLASNSYDERELPLYAFNDDVQKQEGARIYLRDVAGLGVYDKEYPPDNPKRRSILFQKDYAASLRLVAHYGPQAFYADKDFRSPDRPWERVDSIGRRIAQEMDRSQAYPVEGDRGLMTLADLAGYKAVWRNPVVGSYRGHEIIGMPPPSAAGTLTVEILNIMEKVWANYPLRAPTLINHSSEDHLHFFAEAEKIAWTDRMAYVADPTFADVPAFLTSKAYAAAREQEIERDRANAYGPGTSGDTPGKPTNRHTTHISVMDRNGNALAATCSQNSPYGSGVVARGTGVVLNNQMFDFDLPGSGSDPNGINAPAAGKRPRSSMSPTIVVKDGRAILAVGGAGWTRIPMAVTLTISNMIDYGMDVARSVDAARVHETDCTESAPGQYACVMELEKDRVLPQVQTTLRDRGHVLSGPFFVPTGEYEFLGVPRLEAVSFNAVTGQREATSDPRAGQGARGQQ